MIEQLLVEEFKKLNIKDLSVHEFLNYAEKLYSKHESTYTKDTLLNYRPASEIVRRILDYYSESTNKQHPLLSLQQDELKKHSFFKNKPYVCSAPWTTLRFEFGGKITVCCMNESHNLGYYPETTPLKAWFGSKLKELRQSLMQFDFSKGCQTCARFILNGMEHTSVIALQEDLGLGKDVGKPFPSQLIFQLHNTCNFECIMCGGVYSSSIRKNRDALPAFNNAYDDNFLTEVLPFIKKTRIIEFIGGEPFLIPINYKLLELIAEYNTKCKVDIISNGSIFNSRIETILNKLTNTEVHISLDSINPETFSFIRRNGNLETVLTNISKFKSINKMGSIAVCPMIQNIYQIHDIVNYCISINAGIWFNTVECTLGDLMYNDIYETGTAIRPASATPVKTCTKIPEFRLWTLSKEEKQKIIDYLMLHTYPPLYQQKIDGLIRYISSLL